MNTSENIETKDITYTFKLENENYTVAKSLNRPELPSKIQSFAIVMSIDDSFNNLVFDHLINGWKEFYDASMDKNDEIFSGYIILNITVQEAAEIADKSDCEYFSYWNSNKLNIFRTQNVELVDVWSF